MPLEWPLADAYEIVRVRLPPRVTNDEPTARAIRPCEGASRLARFITRVSLFREFAELNTGTNDPLDFAERYGTLGCHMPDRIDGAELLDTVPQLPNWTDERFALWKMLARWDLLTDRTLPAGADEAILFPHGIGKTSKARVTALTAAIADTANSAMARHGLIPRLDPTSPDPDRFRQSLHPATLIGVIWFQAIRALTGEINVVACEGQCGTWLELSLYGRAPSGDGRRLYRADARFCSHGCRARHEQRMLALARRMAREHRSLRDILAATKLKRTRAEAVVRAARGRRIP